MRPHLFRPLRLASTLSAHSFASVLQPEEQPSEIFRYLWDVRKTTGECFLCQFLARHRAEPKERYTTCLFNKPW